MIIDTLRSLYQRDLNKLESEMHAYSDESNLWEIHGDITNSGGNLALHLVGNLNTFIGAQLGGTDYVRDREAEFGRKDVPRAELIDMIIATRQDVDTALSNLKPLALQAKYPIDVFGSEMTTEYFLIHLATHLTYHLGQINYHRRMIEG